MIVAEAVAEYVKEKERAFDHDRTQTVGSSEIGQCARKVFALKFENEPNMQVPRDDDYVDTWGARERGNLIENHLLVPAIIKRYGDKARFLGAHQKTFIDGYISCTPDCLLTDEYGDMLIEFKSIDPRVTLNEPKPEHVYQAKVQMGILHAVSKYRPLQAVISYTDASFFNETIEFTIDYDPGLYEHAKKRAALIMTAESMHEIPPEGWIAGGHECQYCPFAHACGRSRRRIPEDANASADKQFVAEISDRARQLKFVELNLEMQEKQKREIQYEIKERLRERGLRRVVGDGIAVSWAAVKGRETVDLAALKKAAVEAGINIEEFAKVGEESDRLIVTFKANDNSKHKSESKSK